MGSNSHKPSDIRAAQNNENIANKHEPNGLLTSIVPQQHAELKSPSWEKRTKRFISTHSKFPPVSYLKKPLKKDGFIKSKRGESGTINQRQCFDQFMLLSQNFDTPFNSEDPNQWSRFNTVLDPYVITKVDCIYCYPSLFDEESLRGEDISPFCCNGIKVRLVPRSVLQKARELGWTGSRSQDYKFLVVSVFFGPFYDSLYFQEHGSFIYSNFCVTVYQRRWDGNSQHSTFITRGNPINLQQTKRIHAAYSWA